MAVQYEYIVRVKYAGQWSDEFSTDDKDEAYSIKRDYMREDRFAQGIKVVRRRVRD